MQQFFAGLPAYAELQCMSHYSFLRGASSPEQLVDRAQELGYKAIAITDECSLSGIVKAHQAAKACDMHLIIGSQMQISHPNGTEAFRLLVIATTREGYGNLSELITVGRLRADKGKYMLLASDIDAPANDLAHLRGLPECFLIYLPRYGADIDEMRQAAAWFNTIAPGRARIALTLHHNALDDEHKDKVRSVAGDIGIAVVATGDVCMHVRSFKPVQDTMSAIRHRLPLTECGFLLAPNAEQHLRPRLRLGNVYSRAEMEETVRIASECTFSLDELKYEYPLDAVPVGECATPYLRKETYLGAHWRYPAGIPASVQALIEHELEVIEELKFENYFLTVYDIVRFARASGILCQGRGSAANSAVCYCLGVTEVDPARGTLLFERFLSKGRSEPPDIDVDFSHQRREEVYQYIFQRYTHERAGITAVVTSYRAKSVLRDVGAALGIDSSVVLKVAKAGHSWGERATLFDRIAKCGLDPDSEVVQQWVSISETMLTFPRHLSQHPGGFVITRTKLSRIVPIENAAMEGRTVIGWDKDDIDVVGLLKIDILALGMLTCVQRALTLISERRGEPFGLHDIPAEDPATYDMISDADTIGVFQIESRAQMATLARMRPRCFYDLVIEVAIIRPGPIQGGMIEPFLRRREGVEPITYPSPEIESVLSRTLGVPIFQEQVMQIAMVAAGFTAGEADNLRRAMAAWNRKGHLGQYDEKLRAGMVARGYNATFVEALIDQIRGFGEYGFPESHAASFALIAYASSWLKRHEPEAFLAAILNSQPMGYYSVSQLVQDARRHGVQVLPACVNVSMWESGLEYVDADRPAVRLGLNIVGDLQREAAWRIEESRAIRPFDSLHDLALRADIDARTLKLLASAGVLRAISGNRREAVWAAAGSTVQKGLLREAPIEEEVLALPAPTEGEELVADFRHLGMTLGRHPLALLRSRLSQFDTAESVKGFGDRQIARCCGLVTMRQRPQTAGGVVFVTLEDETGSVNVIVWPSLAERQPAELSGSSLMAVFGQWQYRNNVGHLIAGRLVDLSDLLGSLETSSRDYR